MRKFIDIIAESAAWGKSFEELAQEANTVEEFIHSTDGLDVLYRGHHDDELTDHVFMTDYVGHAVSYIDDTGKLEAFAYDPNDVMFFNDDTFDRMRSYFYLMEDDELKATYHDVVKKTRFSDQLLDSFPEVYEVIHGERPYSELSGNPVINDALVPLMQHYAGLKGKNIIAFTGSDYADYGGQNEFVVADVSRLTNLRDVYDKVKGNK